MTLRCPGNEASPPLTQLFVNAGLILNASACHVSTEYLHMYPTVRGSSQTELNKPHIFLPDKVPIILQYESHQLQELTTPTLQALNSVQSNLATPQHSIDVDSLLRMHETSRKSQTEIRLHTIVLITIIALLGLLYFLLRSHFDKLRCATTKTQDTACATSPQTPLQQRRPPERRPRDIEQIDLPVALVYSSRVQTTNNYVREIYFLTNS